MTLADADGLNSCGGGLRRSPVLCPLDGMTFVKSAEAWRVAFLFLVACGGVQAQEISDDQWFAPPAELTVEGTWSEDRVVLLPSSSNSLNEHSELFRRMPKLPKVPAIQYRLPGEFERQAALLVGCCELLREMPDVFADIVEAIGGSVEFIALANSAKEVDLANKILSQRMLPAAKIRYVQIPHNTMWARDYGPAVVEANGKPTFVDAVYSEVVRPEDDQVPAKLAERMSLPVIQSPLVLEGGNLLSNGRGLCVTTSMLINANAGRLDERQLRHWIKCLYGGKETLFLEPLVGESTAHVDMFATFTSADTVVVGAYDPAEDPDNADVLDRNAERLSEVRVNGRPLRVVRIPMPSHDDGNWRTYTNVIFANGVLLVPVYLGVDEKGRQLALDTYSRLLPGWRIVEIDAGKLIECAGALHCVTMNLGPLGRIPDFPRPTRNNDKPVDEKPALASPIPVDDASLFRLSGFGD